MFNRVKEIYNTRNGISIISHSTKSQGVKLQCLNGNSYKLENYIHIPYARNIITRFDNFGESFPYSNSDLTTE
jgi:hypothetical protein